MMDALCDGVRFADDADVLRGGRGGGGTVKSVVSAQMWPIKLHINRTSQMLIRASMLVKAN